MATERKLSSSGRRALAILDAAPGSTLPRFVAAYWSERELATKLRAGEQLIEALVEAGYVSRSINFGRHGPLYTVTQAGWAAIS